MTCNVKIQLLHPDAMPVKAHKGDACFDVIAVGMEVTDDYIEYSLGFKTEMPEGWQGLFYPRSSISKYGLALCNSVGVIDAGYRGEWKARFRKTAKEVDVPVRGMVDFPVYKKELSIDHSNIYPKFERIGQIQFQRVPTVTFEQVETLEQSERGAGGFGSTNLLNHV
ncbi:hypothetical protein MUN82_08910 [Hymenobacter aerilatus]|uniref:dUTP diphosphatase n=1 Tax=Hymenobacter aerilatus TaxID=2932251 RepID=A0A8T9T2L4_9BACT|nr:hypothetical protein [Hymenobacter aerilatus]UOR07203.1 hypothetical protein MUN82_08910 [Hymenobacter aerilatus]